MPQAQVPSSAVSHGQNTTRLSAPAYPSRPGVYLATGELCFGDWPSLAVGGRGWHTGLRRGPQQRHEVVFSFAALLLLLVLWPPASQASEEPREHRSALLAAPVYRFMVFCG